jgi:hypothetical protein
VSERQRTLGAVVPDAVALPTLGGG